MSKPASDTLTCPKCQSPGFTAAGLKRHKCDGKNRSLALTDAKAVELEVVEEPAPLLATKSVNQVYGFTSADQIEKAIMTALADEEAHRRASAIADLRSGVLFFLYKLSLGVNGRKYTGFWQRCKECFGLSAQTVSKKMRLAVTWAKENGADDAVIHQLAAASSLQDPNNEAVTLALNWIGDRTTTDLYRDYGLVSYGPQGGDRSEHRTGNRRTKEAKKFDDAVEQAEDWYKFGFLNFRTAHLEPKETWHHLPPEKLANLADVVDRLNKELKQVCRVRKVRPAKHATWRAELKTEEGN